MMICNNPPLLPNITHHLNYFLRNIIHHILLSLLQGTSLSPTALGRTNNSSKNSFVGFGVNGAGGFPTTVSGQGLLEGMGGEGALTPTSHGTLTRRSDTHFNTR